MKTVTGENICASNCLLAAEMIYIRFGGFATLFVNKLKMQYFIINYL